jgi:hypothetical protein
MQRTLLDKFYRFFLVRQAFDNSVAFEPQACACGVSRGGGDFLEVRWGIEHSEIQKI